MSSYKITKVTTRNYYVTYVRPFMTFQKFKDARKFMRHTPSTCFCCGRKLKDDEMIYLGAVEKHQNEIFCEECGKKIENSIKDE